MRQFIMHGMLWDFLNWASAWAKFQHYVPPYFTSTIRFLNFFNSKLYKSNYVHTGDVGGK
uniref:Uncharacterized protein n=1 Tax=Arundo donax TaxID=35708 RepID=A0A0A8YPZ8_ARUDO